MKELKDQNLSLFWNLNNTTKSESSSSSTIASAVTAATATTTTTTTPFDFLSTIYGGSSCSGSCKKKGEDSGKDSGNGNGNGTDDGELKLLSTSLSSSPFSKSLLSSTEMMMNPGEIVSSSTIIKMDKEEEEVEKEVEYSTIKNIFVWENGTMTGGAIVGVDQQQQQQQQQQQVDANITTAAIDGSIIPDATTSNSDSRNIVTGGEKKRI